jgi:hypothetical protein
MDTSKPLNPIEKNIAAGMSPIVAFLTEATCGEACWNAREEICRCSCGGKNHGCMKTADGTRPTRQSKIDGFRYELAAVGSAYNRGSDSGMYVAAKKINDAVPCPVKYKYKWYETDKGAPARVKKATKDQFAKWPELKAMYDARVQAAKQPGMYLNLLDRTAPWPYLLWVMKGDGK